MNNIVLEDEEGDGLALEGLEEGGNGIMNGIDTKLCVVGKFITEGTMDFSSMQQTMAALWRPGKGVCIKEINVNLYLFRFFHEIDVRRVIEGNL